MKRKIYDLCFTDVNGEEVSFASFEGRYLLIVNVASECGFTSQYQQLQELYENYKEELEIIAFPCNDFGGQEPNNEAEIKLFCQQKYGVTFTIASKVNITSQPQHDIYHWLCNKSENGVDDFVIDWNFYKFLINQKGELIEVLSSTASPFDDQIINHLNKKTKSLR